MREIRFVRMDPTGNLTCLVLDPVAEAERPRVTAALMDRCEQVGYLTRAADPSTAARLEMMGGEFCGNASMAAAVYLACQRGLPDGGDMEMMLRVSGADGPVFCRVHRRGDAWEGRVRMPLPGEIRTCEVRGKALRAVLMPGMVHLIWTGNPLERPEAEAVLRAAETIFSEPAVGLLQWQASPEEPAEKESHLRVAGRLTPLVGVRDSKTLVWETACGSGTAAVAFAESMAAGRPVMLHAVQPGGVLRAEAEWQQGGVRQIQLCGKVKIGREESLFLS